MPDGEGRLSPAEINHVLSWLQTMTPAQGFPVCPISNHQDWYVVETVLQAIVYPIGPRRMLPELTYPFVMVVCKGCGYTLQFNATLMGLYPKNVEAGDYGSKTS